MKNYYDEKIDKLLQDKELLKLKANTQKLSLHVVANIGYKLLWLIFMILSLSNVSDYINFFIFILCLIITAISLSSSDDSLEQYNDYFRNHVVKHFFLKQGFTYCNRKIKEVRKLYTNSSFDLPFQVCFDNYISKIINSHEIRFANISLYVRKNNSSSVSSISYYKGVMMRVNNFYNDSNFIVKLAFDNSIGCLEYTEFDNRKLSENYNMYTNNRVKAIALFSPHVTLELIKLIKEYNLNIELSISKGNLYIRFSDIFLFQFDGYNCKDDLKILYDDYDVILRYYEMINKIMNIFSKNI